MDMSDPRWLSLREAARRFLREDGCTLSIPAEFIAEAWKVVQLVSDFVPSKIELPSVVEGDLGIIGLAQIGGDEPPTDICWVPDCGWNEFSEQIVELLEAGYPGCIGCGGPGTEEEWDEVFRRRQFLT